MAAGRMWISPQAEEDPRAVRMQAQGRGLPAEALLQRYLPPVRVLLRQQWGCVPTTCADGHAAHHAPIWWRSQLTVCGDSLWACLRQGSELPAALVLGQASCSVTISGSHVDPTIAGSWEAPAAQVPTHSSCTLNSLTQHCLLQRQCCDQVL